MESITQKLTELIDEVLGENLVHFNKEHLVNPLTAEREATKIKKPWDADIREEVYKSLKTVLASIEENDGDIIPGVYEDNHFAINVIAREVAGFNHGHTNNYAEDRQGRKIIDGQAGRFPKDGVFGEASRNGMDGHVNIDDSVHNYFSSTYEGTQFKLMYNYEFGLKSIRLFHQGHMNSIWIKTVAVEDLVSQMKEYVKAHEKSKELPWKLTLTPFEYREKIAEFNELAKGMAEIIMLDDTGSPFPVVKIYEDPKTVRDKFLSIGKELGLELKVNDKLAWGQYIFTDDFPSQACRVYISDANEDPNFYRKLAKKETGFENNAMLMPHEKQGLELVFLKAYLADVFENK